MTRLAYAYGGTTTRARIADRRSAASGMIFGAVLASPLIWLMGLNFLAYHLVAGLSGASVALRASRRGAGFRLPANTLFLLAFLASYALSLAINAPGAEPDRVIGSIYNLSYWGMGLLLIAAISNIDQGQAAEAFRRGGVVVLAFAGLATLGGYHLWQGEEAVVFPSLAQRLVPGLASSPLLADSTSISLAVVDWLFGEPYPRSSVMGPYPTALAGLVLCLAPAVLLTPTDGRAAGLARIAALVLGAVALLASLARTSLFALAIGLLAARVIVYRDRKAMLLVACLVALGLAAASFEVVDALLASREGSNESRFELYAYSLGEVFWTNPIFGLGIKPRAGVFDIPIGSHSTYLGAFVKTGFFGLSFLVLWLAAVLRGWSRRRPRSALEARRLWAYGTSLIAMMIWMLTEDIDAPQLVAFLFFCVVGLAAPPSGVPDGGAGRFGRASRRRTAGGPGRPRPLPPDGGSGEPQSGTNEERPAAGYLLRP